jgi:MFS family permease
MPPAVTDTAADPPSTPPPAPPPPLPPGGAHSLWRHPDFLRLWLGQAVSQFGSMVTRDALPLAAVLVLRASPLQMGALSALGFAPVLLLGLPAGVWVDRVRRRPILILADLGRALLVLSVPAAALLGRLTLAHLYVVAAAAGALTLFFDVAYQSYLPALVRREHVLEGNSKLGLTDSLAEIVVPGLTGALVQALSAPLTLLFDAGSYLVSAVSLWLIRAPEPPPVPPSAAPSLRAELAEGLALVARHPALRALVAGFSAREFFGAFYGALYALYVLEVLGFTPALLGLFIASGGLGALLGALLAPAFTRRAGLGPALAWSMLLMGAAGLLIPLAGALPALAVPFMFAAQLAGDLFRAIFAIGALSFRQALTPDRLLGRVNASVNFVQGGATMLGLLAGGALGEWIGISGAVWVAAAGALLAGVVMMLSPVRAAHRAGP